MLLAVDIGNTNLHMGVWQNDAWQYSWRARTIPDKMPDEYAVLLRSYLNSVDIGFGAITGVVVSSVVPALTDTFSKLIDRYIQCDPVFVSSKIDTVVKIAIDQPQQAGADRICNAAAAHKLYGDPAVVVDFGTSTNWDVVSAEGNYIGGAIAPGVYLAHDALVSRAAKLHKVDILPPPDPIGANTIHAMQSGLFWGYIGLVESVTHRIKKSLNSDKTRVVATGGLATLINKYTDVIDTVAPELTLDGLRFIYEVNQGYQAEN